MVYKDGDGNNIYTSDGTNYNNHDWVLNGKTYPSYKITSKEECYYLMKEQFNETKHWIGSMDATDWNNNFVIAQTFEKAPSMHLSGEPVMNSLFVNVNFSSGPGARLLVFSHYDLVCSLYSGSAVVLK